MDEVEELSQPAGMAYDMSFNTNSRINYLLWKCNMCQENDELILWYKCCKNLYKECMIDMKDEEKKAYLNKMKEIETSIEEYNGYISSFNNAQARNKIFSPPRDSFDKLYEFECMLRNKLDKMKLLFKRGVDYGSVM